MCPLILIFSSIVAPILVGVTLVTYKYWLERRSNKSNRRPKF
ncbi:type I toxin-antitoxin system Fst family toxin [Listeria cornellensis]|nr:type I toxin-antitoxin system Fst family toxin [Listeria cornellensis]